MLRAVGWFLVGALVAAAAYELALALGFQSGRVSGGEYAVGEVPISIAAFVAMLVGAGLALVYTQRPKLVGAMLAPAAAVYFAAFFFTYDPYYGPGLERYSQREVIGWGWFVAVVALAVAAGILTRIKPRIGAGATAIVLLLLLLTTFAVGDSH